MSIDSRPLVAHIIYRLAIGGLENGVVNLINHLPEHKYRHIIISLTDVTEFRQRIRRADVDVFSMNKRAGQDIGIYFRLWKIFRRLKPAIVHTRNLATMEAQLPAFLAGVPARVHSEHGREGVDIHGNHSIYNRLRRFYRPLIHTYIPLAQDLERWLVTEIGVPQDKIVQIYNGVDSERFFPGSASNHAWRLAHGVGDQEVLIGTVGRLAEVKDQITLIDAVKILAERRDLPPCKVVIVGDGPLRGRLQTHITELGLQEIAILAGAQEEVPEVLRALDIFVLPSLREGISNTILEAMATGLPVIATAVGGNPELVEAGITGSLIPPAEPSVLAETMARYVADVKLRHQHGGAGRIRVEQKFSLDAMTKSYEQVYDALLGSRESKNE